MTETMDISAEEVQQIIQENQMLRKEVIDLRSLFDAAKALGSQVDLHQALENMIVVATNLLRARDGSILLVDHNSGDLVFKITHGVKGTELVDVVLPKGKGLGGWVAEKGEGLIVNDPENDPRFDSSVSEKLGYKTESILCAPIKAADGKVLGVIQILNKKAGGQFQPEDLSLLETFGSYAAVVLMNSMSYESVLETGRGEFEKTIALGIQKSILPVAVPSTEKVHAAVYYHPSRSLRGEYYDFLERDRDIFSVIESSEEEGILASVLSTIFRTAVKTASNVSDDIFEIDRITRDSISDDIEGQFDRLHYGLIRIPRETPEIEIIRRGDIIMARVLPENVEIMEESGELSMKVTLAIGDKLVVASRGVNQILARNRDGLSPGDKFKEMLLLGSEMDGDTLVETLFMGLSSVNPEVDIDEDITILCFEAVS